jgi:hypothetical protein
MSIESELELRIAALDPQQFERLTYDLVRVDHPSAVRPGMHDGGADVVVPAPPNGRPCVWQAKHYVNAISWSLCVSSLAAAIARYDPEMVTFVFPKDLSARELASFEGKLQADRARIMLWSLSTLRARLQASPNLLRTYFPPVDVNSGADVKAQPAARRRPMRPAKVDPPERDPDFAGLAEVAISTVDPPVTREEVLQHIEMGSPVPARYLYSTETGAENWISVCQAPMNFTYQEAVEFGLARMANRSPMRYKTNSDATPSTTLASAPGMGIRTRCSCILG